MKRKSRMVLACVGALVVLAVGWCLADPIIGKLLLGEARLLRKQIPVTITIDDHQLQNVCCFTEPGKFRNHRSKGLVLWIDDPRATLGRHILVIDLDHEEVLVPNSGARNYVLLRHKWLIQSDSGALGVAFGHPKLDENDPCFERSGSVISFTIPPVLDLPPGRWNLRMDTRDRISSANN